MCVVGKSSRDSITTDLDIADPNIFLPDHWPRFIVCWLHSSKALSHRYWCFLAEGVSNKLCFIRHGFPWFFLVWTNILAHASPTFFHGRMYVTVFRLQALIARDTSSKDVQYVYRTRVHFAIDFISTVLNTNLNVVVRAREGTKRATRLDLVCRHGGKR